MNLKVTKSLLLVALFAWVPIWADNSPATNSGTQIAVEINKANKSGPPLTSSKNEEFNRFLKKTKENGTSTISFNTFPPNKNRSLELEEEYWMTFWNSEGNLDLLCNKTNKPLTLTESKRYEQIDTFEFIGFNLEVFQKRKFIKYG